MSAVARHETAELRNLGTTMVRVESRGDGQGRLLVGTAVPFDREAVIAELFREVFRKGAFARAIREKHDVVCWYQHGRGAPLPLGRVAAGTLRLREEDHGLVYECDLPDTASASELVESIRRGDLRGSSFMFWPTRSGETWDKSETKRGKLPLRILTDVELYDVSPVVRPAYAETSVNVRSAADVLAAWSGPAGAGVDAARLAQASLEQDLAEASLRGTPLADLQAARIDQARAEQNLAEATLSGTPLVDRAAAEAAQAEAELTVLGLTEPGRAAFVRALRADARKGEAGRAAKREREAQMRERIGAHERQRAAVKAAHRGGVHYTGH